MNLRVKADNQKGQALVEFSMLLIIFVLVLLVIIDLGRITYVQVALQNATREGARFGIVNPDDDTQIRNVTKDFALGLDLCMACITIAKTSDTITVSASYDFRTATPVLQWITESNLFTLESGSTMRLEQ